MPKFTWEYLRSRPEEMNKLIDLIGHFDAYTSSETDPRLKNFVKQLVQLRDDPEQVNAEHIFNSGMQMLGDRMGYYIGAKPKDAKETEDILKKRFGSEDLEDLMDSLDLPKPGTGAYVAESMRSQVYDELVGDLMFSGVEQLFCSYAAFNDMVRGQPDWRRATIDQKQLEERKKDIGAELTATSNSDFLAELSNEDRIYMIMSGQDGAGLNSFLSRKYIEGAFGRLAEYRKSAREGGPMFPEGPEQYKIAYDMSPKELEKRRTEWAEKEIANCDRYAAKKVASMLACRAVMQLTPEADDTFWDAGVIGKDTYNVAIKYAPGVVASMSRKDLSRIMRKDQDGAALEAAFRKHIATLDEIPSELPDELRPSAKERIEALQEKVKSKETTPSQKRKYALEIIATREAVGAQRGGAGLDATVPANMRERTRKVKENMEKLFKGVENATENFDKYVVSGVTKGHGGKMVEAYRKYYSERVSRVNRGGDLPVDLEDSRMPTARNRIEELQERMRAGENTKSRIEYRNETIRCVAAILAARENVNAKRGGSGLNQQLRDAAQLARRTRELESRLGMLDGDSLYELRELAYKGHGGEMKNAFEKEKYQKQIRDGQKAEKERQTRLAELEAKRAQREAQEAEQAAKQKEAKERLDKRMEFVRQELGRADNPRTRELCLAEMLYLNDTKTMASPTEQLQRLDMTATRKNVTDIQQSELFQKEFKNNLSDKALEDAKNGKIEGLVSTWNDAAKKHGPQDKPEVEKQRNTVYQKTEHQEVEQAEVRRAQSVRAF